ncbi:uncharacterized protein LOC131067935 [Cryptomeria japonica]|uniref:uncharacterized protein LOC131067935 n=1 Tax=Cryptomeria japonica TaxID=3369 RepID=UPI0027DA22F8|nr:uncharacterized protein LOC131067935 [Cryptomeria japonica]
MKFLTWNVKGCNAPDKRRLIKRGFDQAKLEVICIQETKLGREAVAYGVLGGLGILWNPLAVQVDVVSSSKHWQVVKVISKTMNFSCFLFNVYGPTLAVDKCRLWEDISKRLEEVRPSLAIVAGDFNATLSSSEKRGGVRRLSRSQLNFQSFVNGNALFEVAAKGRNYTWTNGCRGFSNIAEKLDRFFLARDWNLAPLVFEAEVLVISGSDHFSVSLVVQKDEVPIRCPFKVEKMWIRELSFKERVVGWWKEAPARRLEEDLGALNAKVMAEGMDEVDFLTEKYLLSKYGEFLQREEIYWKQKSRENWLKAGDRNTKFFHSSMKARRSLNIILSLWLADGTITEDPGRIGKEVVDFFENLWRRSGIA